MGEDKSSGLERFRSNRAVAYHLINTKAHKLDNETMELFMEQLEAVSPGSYYLGKPCKHGHKGIRYRTNSNCVVCNTQRRKKKEPGKPGPRPRVLTEEQQTRARLRKNNDERNRYFRNVIAVRDK